MWTTNFGIQLVPNDESFHRIEIICTNSVGRLHNNLYFKKFFDKNVKFPLFLVVIDLW